MLGLAAILHASAVLYDTVKYAGVAYLLWMAWQTLQQKGAMRLDGDAAPRSFLRIMGDGIALNLLNPKLSIFFVAFSRSSPTRPRRRRWATCCCSARSSWP